MENELASVLDALAGLVWTALPGGLIDFTNRRWRDYTGLGSGDTRESMWESVVHPDDLALVERLRSVPASPEPIEAEARLRDRNGDYRWFLIRTSPLTDASGQVVKWCGVTTDIDNRKRTEEAAREREARLELVLDELPALVVLLDPSGELQFANRRVLDYFGKSLDELKASATTDAVHPDDLPRIVPAWIHAIQTGEPYDVEHRMRRRDGVYRWFHVRTLPVRDADGRIVLWQSVQTDIDDRKRAETALAGEKQPLEVIGAIQDVTEPPHSAEALGELRSELAHVARVTSLGALTASIAHEVNQPISGIITNANTCLRMLATDPPNVDGARETARRTIRDATRASEVVTRLRALYARSTPTLEPVDLNEATREVIALSRSELARSKATMRAELAEGLPIIMGDRVQLQQVIMNLLRNASDAMIGIDDRPREIVIRTSLDDGDRVCLSVRDSGVGFGSQGADKVFDPFYTTKPDGMGIGLSVSRSIIESHRGRLWAFPNDGPGVTFSFAVPCGLDFGVHGQQPRAGGKRGVTRDAHAMGSPR